MFDFRRLVVVVGGLLLTLLAWATVATARELLGLGTWFVLADISVWIVGVCWIVGFELKAYDVKMQYLRELEVEEATGDVAMTDDEGVTFVMTKDGIFDVD